MRLRPESKNGVSRLFQSIDIEIFIVALNISESRVLDAYNSVFEILSFFDLLVTLDSDRGP